MSTRMITDCDKCGKENVSESYRLDVPVAVSTDSDPGTRRVDLDTKCLGQLLQEFLSKMSPAQGTAWLENISKTKVKPAKKAAVFNPKPMG